MRIAALLGLALALLLMPINLSATGPPGDVTLEQEQNLDFVLTYDMVDVTAISIAEAGVGMNQVHMDLLESRTFNRPDVGGHLHQRLKRRAGPLDSQLGQGAIGYR